jgi:hypothetical protein
MGHRSIANTVIYTAVADKRVRNIWGKWPATTQSSPLMGFPIFPALHSLAG